MRLIVFWFATDRMETFVFDVWEYQKPVLEDLRLTYFLEHIDYTFPCRYGLRVFDGLSATVAEVLRRHMNCI